LPSPHVLSPLLVLSPSHNANLGPGYPRRNPAACQRTSDRPNKCGKIKGMPLRDAVTAKREKRRAANAQEDKMAGTVEKKLADLGIVLPQAAAPVANYVPFVRTGNFMVVSGQLCLDGGGKLVAKGQLGAGVSVEDGAKAARACAIMLLAQLKAALGDLDKIARVVRLGGFINSAPGFIDGPKVMNGASDLMVAAFGDKGRHARTTIGVAALPLDAAVEVEGAFEVS
jgi:enamine deaminase RidA (YjgF/YER057c/UK114 family)